MNCNLRKIFNEKLTDEEKQWYQVVAGYLLSQGGTVNLSAAELTRKLVENGLIEEYAAKDPNPATRFLAKLVELGLTEKVNDKKPGAWGNTYTLNFYIYTGSPLEGVVPWQHPLYIRRTADSRCEECLTSGMRRYNSRAFLKIKSPRYTGKTSLLHRLKEFAKQQKGEVAVGFVDLESYKFSDNLFMDSQSHEEDKRKEENGKNYKEFLDTLKRVVEQEFKKHITSRRSDSSYSEWSNLPLAVNFTQYLEEQVFCLVQKPKVLLIDGIDRILGTHIQDPFFRMLRTWFEEKMKKLEDDSSITFPNIAIAFSTESYFDRESPLQNVGTDIDPKHGLGKFTDLEVLRLAELYGLVCDCDDGSESASCLRAFLGGIPYLTNMALYEMTKENLDLDTLKKQVLFPNSPFLKHLRKIVEKIKECKELEEVFSDWLKDPNSYLDEKSKIQLAKLGAIEFEVTGNSVQPKVTCELYEQYFKQQLLNQNP